VYFLQLLQQYNFNIYVFTGGGNAGRVFHRFPGEYFEKFTGNIKEWDDRLTSNDEDIDLCPLFSLEGELKTVIRKVNNSNNNNIIYIHDFYVHQYFKDLNINKPEFELKNYNLVDIQLAYESRVIEVNKKIHEYLELFRGFWTVIITTDHGECFLPNEAGYCGHGTSFGKEHEDVWQIPLMLKFINGENNE
jgi:hypothetical protein